MGFGGTSNSGQTTPGRKTHLLLDPSSPVLKEAPFAYLRVGKEIARAGFGPNNSANVMRYGAGCIGLKPYQMTPGQLAETAAGNARILPKASFDFPAGLVMAVRPRFRQQTELTGNTYDASVVSSGDNFLVKGIPAGGSWAQSHTADIAAFGQIPVTPSHVPMDRIGIGRETYQADQGYGWRFEVTATQANAPQIIGQYYFGGAAGDGGFGQYGLMVWGDGTPELWEKVGSSWNTRFPFRYAPADRVMGATHQILIKPYLTPAGFSAGYIDFICHSVSASRSVVQSYYQQATA
ncbi:MAG: hypothetical protein H0U63_00305, partial [Burkholderiales bacterium]|nr:hypothetical protein [Burkholderiales bacterium]